MPGLFMQDRPTTQLAAFPKWLKISDPARKPPISPNSSNPVPPPPSRIPMIKRCLPDN